jgi:glucosyl-3-phosphoglycerate synthase
LLLPCLYAEIEAAEVIERIVGEIGKVRYLHSITVVLGGTDQESDFRRAKDFFARLATPERSVRVVWVLGPRVQSILEELRLRSISTGTHGKGQSVWMGLGYIFARRDIDVVALHDCDIVTYDRVMLGRLIEPIANPNKDFEFCKGFYPRISPTERVMKGRVTRLFVVPFLDTMVDLLETRRMSDLARFFLYMRSFRYPLAGEFSLTSRLARGINIANDWGLEVSTLSEIYSRVIVRKIAQVGLSANYEHKHQVLSEDDASGGLHRMVVDIAKFYFNYLRSHGLCLDDSFVEMLRQAYYRNALRFVKIYGDDAETNRLVFDRHLEELTVSYFAGFLQEAWEKAQRDTGESLIPAWNRIYYTLPDIRSQIVEAVEADNTT